MRITIVGGGNIGTLMAAELAHKGNEVTMYTSKPYKWEQEISVWDTSENKLLSGRLAKVTDDLKCALQQADVIFITVPAQLFENLAKKMETCVTQGQWIGVIPGSGGAEFAFSALIKRGCLLFGLQRVHSIARLKEYGRSVYMLGRKQELHVAAIPSERVESVASFMEKAFDMRCEVLVNYLCVTLTPSNPILHTTRLYSLFHEYEEGKMYKENFLFYEQWDNASSELLIACDDELQKLCRELPFELESVVSLKKHYESDTADAMTRKISGIAAFKGLLSPMKEVVSEEKKGWIPDFESRYFTADFSYGLKIIKDIAKLYSVPTPNIDMVWEWYESVRMSKQGKVFELNKNRREFELLYT